MAGQAAESPAGDSAKTVPSGDSAKTLFNKKLNKTFRQRMIFNFNDGVFYFAVTNSFSVGFGA